VISDPLTGVILSVSRASLLAALDKLEAARTTLKQAILVLASGRGASIEGLLEEAIDHTRDNCGSASPRAPAVGRCASATGARYEGYARLSGGDRLRIPQASDAELAELCLAHVSIALGRLGNWI
jgi:hypothetical protein